MTKERWLRVLVPIQGFVLLSQLTTGLNADRIPDTVYEFVHEGGGILLVMLVAIHVGLNWDWVRMYFRRSPP